MSETVYVHSLKDSELERDYFPPRHMQCRSASQIQDTSQRILQAYDNIPNARLLVLLVRSYQVNGIYEARYGISTSFVSAEIFRWDALGHLEYCPLYTGEVSMYTVSGHNWQLTVLWRISRHCRPTSCAILLDDVGRCRSSFSLGSMSADNVGRQNDDRHWRQWRAVWRGLKQ